MFCLQKCHFFNLISVLKDANLKEIKCGITIDMLLIITLKLLVELHKEQKQIKK